MNIPAMFTAVSGVEAASKRMAASAANVANVRSAGNLKAAEEAAAPLAQADRGGLSASRYAGYRPIDVQQETLQGAGVRADYRVRNDFFFPAFDPGNPVADAEGLMAMPNVDLGEETVSMKMARHAQSASLAVLRTADRMIGEVLDERV